MQKLTKEQSDWLIEKLDAINAEEYKKGWGLNSPQWVISGVKRRTMNLIKQYTEKHFPDIHMRPRHVDDIEEVKVYQTDCGNTNTDCIVLYSLEEYTHFNKEQFKEFAVGINEIVEYLDAEVN